MSELSMREQVLRTFQDLYSDVPEVQAAVIATLDGLPVVADVKSSSFNPDKISALVATAVSVAKRTGQAIGIGELNELSMTTKDGKIFLYLIGSTAVLALITPKNISLGMLMMKAGDITKKLTGIIEH